MFKYLIGAVAAFLLTVSSVSYAKPDYRIFPVIPAPASVLPADLTGFWEPMPSDLANRGLGLSIVVGKYFAASQNGLPNTCGNYLELRGSFPKGYPATTVYGERAAYDPQGSIVFGTEFMLYVPKPASVAASVRLNSYDAAAGTLSVTISNNSGGFNGTTTLRRRLQLIYPLPTGC